MSEVNAHSNVPEQKLEPIFEREYWSLFQNKEYLEPLKFSNGKSQADIVEEVVKKIKSGIKVIFLHGVCGTGKSAIALNIARELGKTSIIVPIKSLQRQYEKDYMDNKYVIKKNGEIMNIAMITGRDNHDSIFFPGASSADPLLPDTIKLTEKNYSLLKDYYLKNPFISNKVMPELRDLRRMSIAPANPYWSPIVPASVDLRQLKDANKKSYKGMFGREYIFYHRKKGCSYYDQYDAYIDADVIIFNAAKYLAETSIGRKPETVVDIIDEADEFLDSLSNEVEINLSRLTNALSLISPDNITAKESIKEIKKLIGLEELNKNALGIDEEDIFPLVETKLLQIMKILLNDPELDAEISIDELNYANHVIEAANHFRDAFQDTYVSYKKEDNSLYATLVTTNLEKKFNNLIEGNKALVLMSGTLHDEKVIQNIYGIKEYAIVEAEGLNQGAIEIIKTGAEFDCKYSNFQTRKYSREDYLKSLSKSLEKSIKPVLIHVNSFNDLPSYIEKKDLHIDNIENHENLREAQLMDKSEKRIAEFKKGKTDILFTTKCSRGIDFPGNTCNSVIFTKYPNPNVKSSFWKILKQTHPQYYWDFYKDKAYRSFLQRLYRAVRSKDDHVNVLSPDSRVLDAVRKLQINSIT